MGFVFHYVKLFPVMKNNCLEILKLEYTTVYCPKQKQKMHMVISFLVIKIENLHPEHTSLFSSFLKKQVVCLIAETENLNKKSIICIKYFEYFNREKMLAC